MYDTEIRISREQWVRSGMNVPDHQHTILWRLFPNRSDERRGFVFRVAERPWGYVILMSSQHRPDFSRLGIGVVADSRIREPIVQGAEYNFVVRTTPVRRHKGNEWWVSGEADMEKWIREKMEGAEITILKINPERRYVIERTGQNHIRMNPVNFVGRLTVKDVGAFERVLDAGLGRKGNFGMGLVVITKIGDWT